MQVSSMGGQMSFAGFVLVYSATKFALEGMSEALADEVRPLGIKVLIVEPGAFRTALFSNISASAQIADYAATVGPTRHMIEAGNGTQPGDPAKAAAAILTALGTDPTPLRLPLGDDAVDAILGHLDSVRREVTAGRSSPATPASPGPQEEALAFRPVSNPVLRVVGRCFVSDDRHAVIVETA